MVFYNFAKLVFEKVDGVPVLGFPIFAATAAAPASMVIDFPTFAADLQSLLG